MPRAPHRSAALAPLLLLLAAAPLVSGCDRLIPGRESPTREQRVRTRVTATTQKHSEETKERGYRLVRIEAQGPRGKTVTAGPFECTLDQPGPNDETGTCSLALHELLFPQERGASFKVQIEDQDRPLEVKIDGGGYERVLSIRSDPDSLGEGPVLTATVQLEGSKMWRFLGTGGAALDRQGRGRWRFSGPPGATLEIFEQSLVFDKDGRATIDVDFADQLWDAPITRKGTGAKRSYHLSMPVSLAYTPPDERIGGAARCEHEGHLEIRGWEQLFARVEQGGLAIPGDDGPTPGRPRGFMWSRSDGLGSEGKLERPFKVSTKIQSMRDIDVVVLREDKPSSTKRCGPYGPQRLYRSIRLFENGATAYDRRTGKKLASKGFKSTARCPKSMTVTQEAETGKTVSTSFRGDQVKGASTKLAKWAEARYGG